jgi:hypothetical protein
MEKIKCSNCGLVNFSNAFECKRCDSTLSRSSQNHTFPKISKVTENIIAENRKFGLISLAAGLVSIVAPWILTFYFRMNHTQLNGILIVGGFSFLILGSGVGLFPPHTKLAADENKTRNGILLLTGLLLGLVEAYFFNKALGLW